MSMTPNPNPSPELRAMNLMHRIAHRYKNGSGKLDDIARSAFSWMQEADRIIAGNATPFATSHEAARQVFRKAAEGYGRAGTADLPGGPDMSMDDAANVYAALSQTLPAPGEVERLMRAMVDHFDKHGVSPEVGDHYREADRILSASARQWFPHLCFAGEPMHEGQFREPWPMDEERTALAKTIFDGWYEGNEDWDSPHNDHLQTRAYFAADAAIRLLSQGGGK